MAETKMDDVKDAVEEGGEKITGRGNGSFAKRYGIPAAAGIGTLAATYAARKVPDLIRNNVTPKVEEKGGEEASKIGKQALDRMTGPGGVAAKALGGLAGGGSSKGGREKTRRLPIQRWTDIAAPVSTVYSKWIEFEEFPKFMHRVLSVQQEDDKKVRWEEKIWFSRRQWEGEITERRRNDRIAWKTVSGTSHEGVITFHKLDDKLTRVMVDMDFHPSGMIEKMGSGMRFVKRAVQADLARFKAYVELGEAEGLEYNHETEAGGKKHEEDEENEQRESNGHRRSSSQSRSQSSGNGSRTGAERSSEDNEKARQERAERREQRRA
jgi:uncharacterized membrane protein